MRLGGPLFEEYNNTAEWVAILNREGFRAAYCPVGLDTEVKVVDRYRKAARENDIIIAEVGAWSNPLSSSKQEKTAALNKCKRSLELAERVGAGCCVNIAGSRSRKWDGPHKDNFSRETFDLIVSTVQEIIDDVGPEKSFFTLEPMPWIFPDSAEGYQELIQAVDRKQFGVHWDPVNMICSPRRFFGHKKMIEDFISELDSKIKSCHLKDIILSDDLTTHLDETIPGQGGLDYLYLLKNLNSLEPDIPVMMEHLAGLKDRRAATNFIRTRAAEIDIEL